MKMKQMFRSLLAATLLSTATAAMAQNDTSRTANPLREHMVHEVDALGLDLYRDDRIPTFPDTTICYLYVSRKQNGPLWIRLQVRYASYNALGMTKIRFSKGDKALELTPLPDLLHYGTNGMMQWEWYDTPPSESEAKAILAIIAEPGVSLTLFGKDRTEERLLSENERLAMQNVLEQARVLGRARP